MKNIQLSIIIPAYNAAKTIERCIESLKKQSISNDNYEIIMVDDGSKDKTVEIAKLMKVDQVISVAHHSLGRARNLGIKNANGKYIAFIDSDCKAKNNWVEVILRELEQNKVIAGSLLNGNTNLISWSEYLLEFSDYSENRKRNFTKFAAGANQAYHKNILLKISGHIEDMSLSEDVYFGHLILSAGIKICFIPELQVYHYGRINFREYLANMERVGKRNYKDSKEIDSIYSNFLRSRFQIIPVFFIKSLARLKSATKAKKLLKFIICSPIIFFGVLAFCKGFSQGYEKT